MSESTRCPCGSGVSYADCCEPYLVGTALPQGPEALMRSRYTAFFRNNVDYLIATHHPSERRPDVRKTLTASGQETEWLSLRVQESTQSVRGDRGTVTFVAFYRHQGTIGQLRERSNFVREGERWYYFGGTRLEPIDIGRNEPCWCGSGRKLKQCHRR